MESHLSGIQTCVGVSDKWRVGGAIRGPRTSRRALANPQKGVFLSVFLLFGATLFGDIPRSVAEQRS